MIRADGLGIGMEEEGSEKIERESHGGDRLLAV